MHFCGDCKRAMKVQEAVKREVGRIGISLVPASETEGTADGLKAE